MAHPGIRNDATRSTVLRAVGLLDTFTAADADLPLGEIATRAGLPKSTTHRLAADLVEAGLLALSQSGYRLGDRLFELGHLVPSRRRLSEVAMPFLQDLRTVTTLTTNLAVPDGGEIVYVMKLPQRGTRVPHSRIGGRLPMHCTALGKAILAFLGPDAVELSLRTPRRRPPAGPARSPAALRAELAEIARTRVAHEREESAPGLFCVASPVFGPSGPIGAISVTGATRSAQSQRLAPAVLAVALAISREMRAT